MHEVEVIDHLMAFNMQRVYIYGMDFVYNPTAGKYDGGQLTGLWESGTPFSLDLRDTWDAAHTDTYSNLVLVEVPEPATMMLLAIGGVVRLKRKRGTNQ